MVNTEARQPALVSLTKWERSVGITSTTTWRWRKRGWLKVLRIANRNYLSADGIEEFLARAKRNEFTVADRDLAKLGKEGR
jgi:predicted site-specific integrase-resolvase